MKITFKDLFRMRDSLKLLLATDGSGWLGGDREVVERLYDRVNKEIDEKMKGNKGIISE